MVVGLVADVVGTVVVVITDGMVVTKGGAALDLASSEVAILIVFLP